MFKIVVDWADGRITEHVYRTRSECFDVVSGNAHPFIRYHLYAMEWTLVRTFTR